VGKSGKGGGDPCPSIGFGIPLELEELFMTGITGTFFSCPKGKGGSCVPGKANGATNIGKEGCMDADPFPGVVPLVGVESSRTKKSILSLFASLFLYLACGVLIWDMVSGTIITRDCLVDCCDLSCLCFVTRWYYGISSPPPL